MQKVLTAVVAGALAFALAGSVDAAEKYWNKGSGSYSFDDGGNWTGGVPGGGDNARFETNGTYTVTFPSSPTTSGGYFDAPNAADVTLSLGGNTWTNSTNLMFGNTKPNNTVTVSGGTVQGPPHIYVGFTSAATNSRVVVAGSSALLTNSQYDVSLGFQGAAASLLVTNGGVVKARRDFLLGVDTTANGVQAVVAGAGSLLQCGLDGYGFLVVGVKGSGATLRIEDGGRVISRVGRVAGGSSGYGVGNPTGSQVIVSGGFWTNTAILELGATGSVNSVEVSNTGRVYAVNEVQVGCGGQACRLSVLGSGTVESGGHFVLGVRPASTGSTLVVSGSNAVVKSVSYDVHVGTAYAGAGSAFNTVIVSNGGQIVSGRYLYIGESTGATGNQVTVTGPGSVLRSTSHVYVGYAAPLNSLRVDNQATAISPWHLLIGEGAGAYSNALYVTGQSLCSNYYVYVGRAGSYNSAYIGSGGVLYGNALYVGDSGGIGNTLYVQTGGTATAYGHFYMGSHAASSNNAVVVSGTGAVLRVVLYDLNIGTAAGGQSITVSNGGAVASGPNRYCYMNATSGNRLLVTGNGSSFRCWGFYLGGATAANNTALVTDGGTLDASGPYGWSETIVIGAASGNVVSNTGGYLEFDTRDPYFNTPDATRIQIASGGVSFRDQLSADVFCSQGTYQLATKATWSGANTFRLKNASTRNDISQTYTFNTGLGATNFARLEMVNGTTAYRNGRVTIGSGGSLLVSNTVATFDLAVTNYGAIVMANSTGTFTTALVNYGTFEADGRLNGTATCKSGSTFAPGGTNGAGRLTVGGTLTLESGTTVNCTLNGTNAGSQYDQLVVGAGGTINLGGTFTINLAMKPDESTPFRIVDNQGGTVNGTFANSSTTVTFDGKPYRFVVRYNGGDGNDVELVYAPPQGTVVLVR